MTCLLCHRPIADDGPYDLFCDDLCRDAYAELARVRRPVQGLGTCNDELAQRFYRLWDGLVDRSLRRGGRR